MKNFLKKSGFTIAELTIAMILVAGIAMIMMPSLMKNNEKQIFVTALKKTYTQLQQTSQAIGLLKAQGRLASGLTASETVKQAVRLTTKLMPLTSEAKFVEYIGDYKVKKVSLDNVLNRENTLILKNGMFFMFKDSFLILDINGIKSPNVVGKDVFYFEIVEEDTMDGTVVSIQPYDRGGACSQSISSNNCACPKDVKDRNYGGFNCATTNPEECESCAYKILRSAKGSIDYY